MKFHQKNQGYRFFCLATALMLVLLGTISVRLAIARYQAPLPQAILTLGGGSQREEFTAKFAQADPAWEIWVSSGTVPESAHATFRAAGIADSKVHLNYSAVDTVTNFTSIVADLERHHVQHLYLITSDYHMARALAIATFVLGSRGIAFTPVSVPSEEPPESWLRILRDACRAILWVFTGFAPTDEHLRKFT